MSLIFRGPNSVVKFPIGSFHDFPVLFDELTTFTSALQLVDEDISFHLKIPIHGSRALDLGGSGDCFLLCLNAYLARLKTLDSTVPVYRIDDIYSRLGINPGVYLGDEHLVQFLGNYPVTIIVIRVVDGVIVANQYNEYYDNIVYILNTYPSHFYLLDKCYMLSNLISITTTDFTYNPTNFEEEEIKDEWNKKDEGHSDNSEGSESSKEGEESYYKEPEDIFENDPGKCVIEDVDLQYLFKFVDSRYTIKKSGKALTAADSKAYFKIRHNLFKSVFLKLCMLNSTEEKTFRETVGLDSDKTPDFLERVNNVWLLLEFTVVKRKESAIKTKQSRSKYSGELHQMRQMGFTCKELYPTLILGSEVSSVVYDFNNVAQIMGLEPTEDPEKVFSNLQSRIRDLEADISELLPELLYNVDEIPGIALEVEELAAPVRFKGEKRMLGVKRERQLVILALIKKHSFQMLTYLRRVSYKAKFVIVVNLKTSVSYIDISPDGGTRNVLLTILQNDSSTCLDYTKVIGATSEVTEPFKIFGESKVTEFRSRADLTEESYDLDSYRSHYLRVLKKCAMKSEGLLADSPLASSVDLVEAEYDKKLQQKRSSPNVVLYDKNYFLFPCMSSCRVGKFKKPRIVTGLPTTDYILSRISRIEPREKVLTRDVEIDSVDNCLKQHNKCYKRILELTSSRKLTGMLKATASIRIQQDIMVREGFVPDTEFLAELDKLNKSRFELSKVLNEDARSVYKNKVTVPLAFFKRSWEEDMIHYRKKKGDIRVCQDRDMTELNAKFSQLLAEIWSNRQDNVTDDIYSDTEPIGLKLKDLLEQMRDLVDEKVQVLMKTQLMHDLQLVSRLCYTLMYLSNIRSSKNDFYFDNLGYEDVVLLVKGGKKILGTKSSRIFKLIFPIIDEFAWLYNSTSTKLVRDSGKTYCCLSWQSWRFPTLKTGCELYYSFSNYYICSMTESNMEEDLFRRFVFTKVLNMYSQRRKIEIWFGFFRYLYLNSLATHTNLLELINDMVDYDYDPYFYYCQRRFKSKYIDIYKHSQSLNIFDIMTEDVYDNFDLCAEKFDEAIFMAKAPFERENEHLKNLRSVLTLNRDFHSKYSSDPSLMLKQTAVSCYQDDYFEDVFSEDFKFDPELCFSVGIFAASYFKKSTTLADLSNKFSQIVSGTYTEISTSKGMRSDDSHFWGRKGHEVIFDNERQSNIVKHFLENKPENFSDLSKMLRDNHISFVDFISNIKKPAMVFDMKDKAQWKGSREIYVMSEMTKALQNPLEKFFKHLCSFVPNELIHKKSHVRPRYIHSQVFEYDVQTDEKMYCTLDCRKWAPKSNLWKYYYFMKGMSSALPREMVSYFNKVWSLMFSKVIRIQSKYVEKLKKNSSTKDLVSDLVEREDGDYDMPMPYSFMMGIFNYLSSLFHAISQLYFNDLISSKQGVTVNLIAHSDDSGGVILSKSYNKNVMIFKQYEIFQKGLNHMLSRKKCSLSKNFFEMISIMYAQARLIPMTHKFLANVSFEPKGKGWVDDISTVVSKIVELNSNGASLLQCYLTMLSMGEMIRKFYHLPRIKNLSRIPLAFGGLFNMHPLHLILLGADAQEIMLDVIELEDSRNFRIAAYLQLLNDYIPGKGGIVNYRIQYYKRHGMVDDFENDELRYLKIISSCLPKTTLGDVLAHYSRLKDQAYVYSLQGVDMCQIYVMTLFTKTQIIFEGEKRKCMLYDFCRTYAAATEVTTFLEKHSYPFSQYQNYMVAAESMKIDLKDISMPSLKTCKPVIYNTFETIGLNLSFQQVNEIIAYNSGEEYRCLFPDTFKMDALTSWVMHNHKFPTTEDLAKYLMKLNSKDLEKVRSCYSFMPSGLKLDTVERFWTYSVFYCTRRYLVSVKKPQYFTLDQFSLWGTNYQSLKHYYFLLKLAFRVDKKADLLKNADCPKCKSVLFKPMIEEVYRLKSINLFEKTNTNLSFVVYKESQRRSINIWYGSTEFVLYTDMGSVRSFRKDGVLYYEFLASDEGYLPMIYFQLKNFLYTRGLPDVQTSYSVNDSSDFKLGFSDLNTPIVVSPGVRGIMVEGSKVEIRPYFSPQLSREETGFTVDGEVADFEIYFNYDLNQGFYEDHNLHDISHLIFDQELKISVSNLYPGMLLSKVFKIISCDTSHNSLGRFDQEYGHENLLGSKRSLTRALVLADSKGVTKYRSSANPKLESMALLENYSYRDIPVVDLVGLFSFSRLTFTEKLVIDRLVTESGFSEKDKLVLDNIVAKMGLSPTMNAITVCKVIFRYLSYDDVPQLPENIISDFLYTMLKSALLSIKATPVRRTAYQAEGTVAHISNTLVTMILLKERRPVLAEYMVKIFLRAHNDDAATFWNNRKDNVYCAMFHPQKKALKTHFLYIQSLLSQVMQKGIGYDKILQIRQLLIAKRNMSSSLNKIKKLRSQYDDDCEYVRGVIDTNALTMTDYIFYPTGDEDEEEEKEAFFDFINGSEDPEELYVRREDFDIEDNQLEDEDIYILGAVSYRSAIEFTLLNTFEDLAIYTFDSDLNFPWLGRFDVETVYKFNMPWFRYTFPGKLSRNISLKHLDELSLTRVESKPLNVLQGSVEETKGKGKGKVLKTRRPKGNFFGLKTDEEVYNYQRQILQSLNFTDIDKYEKLFFKKSDLTSEQSFWASFDRYLDDYSQLKVKSLPTVKRRSNVLAGHTGNLLDSEARAEINALFKGRAEQIVSGNHCISVSSYTALLSSFKRLYYRADDNSAALIIIMLATMKDAIIGVESDGWYVDSLLAAVNWLDGLRPPEEGSLRQIPQAVEGKFNYQMDTAYD